MGKCMIHSYEIDLRILFRKFYCPVCGERLFVVREITKLTESQQAAYYKELYPHGIPIKLDVGNSKQIFVCSKCNYCNTTENHLQIHKKQKQMKKKIITEND